MYGTGPAILVFALLAALAPGAVLAQGEGKRFAIEGMSGTARVFDGTLTVRQDGQPELTHAASYRSDSFEPPFYYTARLRYLQDRAAWELQITRSATPTFRAATSSAGRSCSPASAKSSI